MMLVLLSFMVCAAIVLGLVAIRGMLQSAPKTEREYQDPLPAMLRMIWPLVTIATHVVGPRMSSETMEKSHRALQSAGQDYLVSPEELVGLRVVGAGIAMAMFMAVMLMLKPGFGSLLMAIAFGFPVGWFYPTLWLSDRRKIRVKKVIRDLPVFLDFITMSVEAGLNITGAIEQAVSKGPAGPLGQEFSRMLRDLRAGLPRSEALRRLADRMDIAQISSFTSALIQADRVGASLGDTLRAQSMQRREERFLRAEKLALEAPVKMMFPLVTCFFPLVFIVLAYFIYLKMVQDGIL